MSQTPLFFRVLRIPAQITPLNDVTVETKSFDLSQMSPNPSVIDFKTLLLFVCLEEEEFWMLE